MLEVSPKVSFLEITFLLPQMFLVILIKCLQMFIFYVIYFELPNYIAPPTSIPIKDKN